MDVTAAAGFLRYFNDLPDRRAGNKIHKSHDLIVIAVMAVIRGSDGWAQVQQFGQAKHKWLATFLELPGGIPSHDTFGRFFARLEPAAVERCFLAWMSALVEMSGGRLVAIDGKAIRNSFADAWDRSGMAHLVSAMVCQGGNRMVFGQVAVDGTSNEIIAIPKLAGADRPQGGGGHDRRDGHPAGGGRGRRGRRRQLPAARPLRRCSG